jgi:ATP-dependent DNA helicase MPH1
MAKNPHFRVLALTATPGNNPEAVQTLVDGLHISWIEIRDEQSVDLRAYIHKKVSFEMRNSEEHELSAYLQVFKAHIITANEGLAKVRDLLVKVMDVSTD